MKVSITVTEEIQTYLKIEAMHFNISKLQEGNMAYYFFNDLRTLPETVIDGYERKGKDKNFGKQSSRQQQLGKSLIFLCKCSSNYSCSYHNRKMLI